MFILSVVIMTMVLFYLILNMLPYISKIFKKEAKRIDRAFSEKDE